MRQNTTLGSFRCATRGLIEAICRYCVLAFVVVTWASVGWADDSLPEFDAETITGDGLVALCAKMDRPLAAEEVDALRGRA